MPYTRLDPTIAEVIPPSGLADPLENDGLTLAQMRGELRATVGARPDVPDTRLDLWINLAYAEVFTNLKHVEAEGSLSFELIEGQSLYLMPYEVYVTRELAVVIEGQEYPPEYGGRPLTKTTLQDYRKLPALRDSVPTKFFRHSRNLLVVYPEPTRTRTMTLDYIMRPVLLERDEDSPILGVEWHEGILLSARAKAHRALLEAELAALAENDFINFVRKRTSVAVEEDKTRKQVTATPVGYKTQLYRTPYRPSFGDD